MEYSALRLKWYYPNPNFSTIDVTNLQSYIDDPLVNFTTERVVEQLYTGWHIFHVNSSEFILGEPDTTRIFMGLEYSGDSGENWNLSAYTIIKGYDGAVTPPGKVPGAFGVMAPQVGYLVRGVMFFETADSDKRRFGITGIMKEVAV